MVSEDEDSEDSELDKWNMFDVWQIFQGRTDWLTEPDPGLVAAGFVSDTIASSAEAGNEGGLLKCLFIVRSRFDVCKISAAQDMGDLQKRLHDCGCEVGAVVDSADVQALSGNDWARTRTHSDPCWIES